MQWLRKKQNKSITAVRSCGENTYVAKVSQKGNEKPMVELADKTSFNINKPDALKQLVKQYRLNQSSVSYLLEFDEHQLIQIEKPSVEDAELKEASRWALQDLINAPVEELTIDTIDIPKALSSDQEQDFIYVFYANNARIGEISNQLVDANVNLKSIEARVMAQRNIANLLAKPDEGEAILSFSSAGALVTFSYQGEICNARFIEVPLEKSDSSFEKIALEIQRSLDGFEARFRHVFIKRLLVAPFDIRDQFCEHLSNSIYTEVVPFDLDTLFDFADGVEVKDLSTQASFMPVLGAALRSEAVA